MNRTRSHVARRVVSLTAGLGLAMGGLTIATTVVAATPTAAIASPAPSDGLLLPPLPLPLPHGFPWCC